MSHLSAHPHPYSPSTLTLPNYVPNTIFPLKLVTYLTLLISIIVLTSWISFARRQNLSVSDTLTFIWLVVCSYLHLIFESFVVIKHTLHAWDPSLHPPLQSQQSFHAQLWKEYSFSDSRYILPFDRTHDDGNLFLRAIETLTILILGPLCVYTAWLIVKRKPGRWVGQLVVSVMHFYGCMLYFGTGGLFGIGGNQWCSQDSPVYFWGYFVGGNSPWIIVPLLIIYRASREIVGAVETFERLIPEKKTKAQ